MLLYYSLIKAVAGIAQSVEQLIRNQQVAGSSPVTSSKNTLKLPFLGVFCYKSFWLPDPHFWNLTHNARITNQFFEKEIVWANVQDSPLTHTGT